MTAIGVALLSIPVIVGLYAYLAYPLLLWLIGLARRPSRTSLPAAQGAWPFVTIVIPAYNEEAQIRGAIEALLAQDYPADRRQILIVSDCSSDRTDDIVKEYASRGVELLRMPTRSGKTAAENTACALIRGEIVVNSDASIRFQPSTVRLLVERMVDPSVGVASGRDVSVAGQHTNANTTEAGYVGYEMWVRRLETRAGGIVGASGSGYAIRTHLHRIPLKVDLSRDFTSALTARTHGLRAVSVDEAICIVPRTPSLRREYQRKVRTIGRGIETLIYQRHLLNIAKYGSFAFKVWSHKVCRWLLPPAALVGLVGLILLAVSHTWALALLALAVAVCALASLGWIWPPSRPMPRLLSIATFGMAANLAVLHALWRVVRGHQDTTWEPTRRTTAPARS